MIERFDEAILPIECDRAGHKIAVVSLDFKAQ